jgi:hypothetical protein
MRYISLSLFILSILWLGCRKEPIRLTGKTATIEVDSIYKDTNKIFTGIDPNCTAFDPLDFPATGAAPGRVVVNGRVTQLDGSRTAGTLLWLLDGLNVVSQIETDINGRFKFDVAADTSAAVYYYVVVNPLFVFSALPERIRRYNCGQNNYVQKNRIQTLDVSFCEGAVVYLKAVKKTDADSVGIKGTAVYNCGGQPQAFGFTNRKTDKMVSYINDSRSAFTMPTNSPMSITIERFTNGVKTTETKMIKADSLTKTITLEL